LLLVSAGTLGGQFIWFGYQSALSYRPLCFLFLSLFSRHGSSLYYLFSILMNDKAPICLFKNCKATNQVHFSYFPTIFSKEGYIIMVLDKGFVISLS
jgi:hypothetical protein